MSRLAAPFTEIPPELSALLTLPAVEASLTAGIVLPCFLSVLGGDAFLLLYLWLIYPLTMHCGLVPFSVPAGVVSLVLVAAAG